MIRNSESLTVPFLFARYFGKIMSPPDCAATDKVLPRYPLQSGHYNLSAVNLCRSAESDLESI